MLGTRVTRAVYTRAPLKLQLRALGLHRRYVHNGSKNDEGSSTSTTTNKEENDKKLPDVYPQMLALPISRRPLFPGFYKAVVISEPRVMKAITDMVERQQPYIGAFMLKDSNNDTDIIHDISEVHELGVLAQVTSAFPSKDEKTGKETMTALLYPHKRIKIDQLIPPKDVKIEDIVVEKVVDNEVASEETKDEETVDKTESATDKVSEEITEEIAKAPSTEVTEDPDNYENPTDFLKDYNVTLVNVSNLEDEPFDIKSPIINALTSEILKVFKEISQLNSMFREQIATFSASIQSATTNIFEEPAKLADFAAAVSAGEEEELQEVLESLNIEQRLENLVGT